ncbi:hypothetical protein CcaCcLH18_12282 [Colletotrichum camelliae]|nr:hypothetical protein CcaCcLH18_12282 [Colletotrichum camelliae]
MAKRKSPTDEISLNADEIDYAHTKHWFRQILAENATEKPSRDRAISVSTADRVKSLLKTCDLIDQEKDAETKELFHQSLRFGKEEIKRRLRSNSRNSDLVDKLEDFNERTFLLRYGDYAGNFLNKLRTTLITNDSKVVISKDEPSASNSTDTSNLSNLLDTVPKRVRDNFRTNRWTQINLELSSEEAFADSEAGKDLAYEGPMTTLLGILSRELGNDPSSSRSLLRLYAERNLASHSSMKECLENRNWTGLATLVATDAHWLETEAPKMASIRHMISPALYAVNAYQKKFFNNLKYNKKTGAVEGFDAKLQSLPKTIRSAKKPRLTEEEQDAVRKARSEKTSSVFEEEADDDVGISLYVEE